MSTFLNRFKPEADAIVAFGKTELPIALANMQSKEQGAIDALTGALIHALPPFAQVFVGGLIKGSGGAIKGVIDGFEQEAMVYVLNRAQIVDDTVFGPS